MTSKNSPRRGFLFGTLARGRVVLDHAHLLQKITALMLLMSLSSGTLLAAPEAPVSIRNSILGIKQDISHAIATGGPGLNVFSLETVKAWLARLGKKQQALDRIAVSPTSEDTTLTVMQGERVVFSATGYAGDDAVGGIDFKWTVQDAEQKQPVRNLVAGVFEAKRPGVYTVAATADDGMQARVTVTVNFNEGYGVKRLLEKPDGQRTDKEKLAIAAMQAKGSLTSRDINSKSIYNADSERQLYETDKLKRGAANEKQIERRQQFPNPLGPVSGGTGSITGKNEIDRAVSQADMKRRKGGPSADDEDGNAPERTEPKPETVKKTSAPLLNRLPDDDGWNGGNWYTASAPVNQVGSPAGFAPDAGATNGDYQINAPVLSLPGRGIDVNLALVYNSRLWSKSGTVLSYDSDKGSPAPGWNIGFGKMMYMGTGGCMIVTADGTRRSYTGTNTTYSSGSYYSTNYTGKTSDGSFTDFSCGYSSSTYGKSLSGYATLPNGTTISYGSPDVSYDQIYPTQITDAQGNYITISYVNNQGPNISTISDTLGRTITFNYETGTNRLISITGPGYNGTTRTYVRLHYVQFTLNYSFASGYTTDVAGGNTKYFLDAIYYPDTNTGYWFGDSDSYSSYGMIAKVVQQRGMSWSGTAGTQGTVTAGTMTDQKAYNFTLTPLSTLTDSPYYTTMTESWANMDTSAVQTGYAIATSGTDQVITVTMPDGTVNKQTSVFSSGMYYQGEVYASASASVPMSKTKTTLATGDWSTTRPSKVEVTDELQHTTATTFTYAASSYNQLITQQEYGYGGTTLYRQTNNAYYNDAAYINRHIFNLLKSTEAVDAAGTRLTRTEYQYDNNAVVNGTGSPNLVAATGVTHHNDTSDPFTTNTHQEQGACLDWYPDNYSGCEYEGQEVWVPVAGGYYANCSCNQYEYDIVSNYDPNTIFRGNVTKVTTYSSASNLTGAISYDFTYDVTGNQRTATTDCCQQVSFGYTTNTQFSRPETHTKGSSDPNSPLRMTESATYDFNTGVMLTSTDFNGRTTTTGYDAVLRPTLVTLPTGGKTTLTYDDANLTSTQTVQLYDNTIVSESSSTLNGRGQPVYSKYLAGASNWNATSVQYDNIGRKSQVSLPYDSAGSPSQWTVYAYDALSRVTQVTAPDGSTSKTFYNETTRPDSASTSLGQTVRTQDAWGRERWARTDDFGRLAEIIEPSPSGGIGNPVNVASASNGGTATASSEYNGSYLAPASGANNGDRKGLNWSTGGYWNDATSGAFPDWLQIDFNGSKTISEIDVFTLQDDYNNPSDPTETMTFTTYGIKDFDVQYWDGSAWVTVTGGSVTNNDKVWRKFAFSAVTTSKIRVVVNGAVGNYSRITEVEAWTQPAQTNATGSVFDPGSLQTTYAYDPLDQLTAVTQGSQTRLFKYDSLGRLTRQKLAEQTATINGAGTYVGAGGTGALWSDAFTYDARSNLTQRIDARGVKANFSYLISGNTDPLNRLQSISYDTSSADTTYTINAAPSVTLSYMTTGDQTRVVSVTTAGVATETNGYDTEGRISDSTLTLTNRSSYPMQTSYSYDTANRLTQITYPAQYGMAGSPRKTVTPSYDQASRLTQLNVNGQTQLSELVYNPMSQVTSLKTGAATGNSDVEQYSYDSQTGLLTNQKVIHTNTSATLLDLSYEYNRGNSNGNLNGKTGQLTHISNNLDHNKDRVFEFDAIGRLVKAKGGAATGISGPIANWTQTYAFDRYGNKTSVTATGITADSNAVPTDGLPTLAYDNTSNRINVSGWQYDNAGNLVRGQNSSGVWQRFEYDAAGRLVKIKDDSNNILETYTYGSSRNRLINQASGQTIYYAWGGGGVIQEYLETSGNPNNPIWAKSYVYAGRRLLSTTTNSSGAEVTEIHHPDRLGTRLVTNPSAGTSYEQSTLPFGTTLNAESTGYSNRAFTSYDRGLSTGLDYALNRTYSPGQGRFTQVDPIGRSASKFGIPQSLNLYIYAGNNPIDFVDPTGLNAQAVDELCSYSGKTGPDGEPIYDGSIGSDGKCHSHAGSPVDIYWTGGLIDLISANLNNQPTLPVPGPSISGGGGTTVTPTPPGNPPVTPTTTPSTRPKTRVDRRTFIKDCIKGLVKARENGVENGESTGIGRSMGEGCATGGISGGATGFVAAGPLGAAAIGILGCAAGTLVSGLMGVGLAPGRKEEDLANARKITTEDVNYCGTLADEAGY